MKAAALLIATPLLFGAGVQAQTAGSGSEDIGREAVARPMRGMRPADVVAALAREAMTAPEGSAAWAALAGALPDLALSGADVESTFAAAQVARGFAPPDLTPTRVPEGAARDVRSRAEAVWASLKSEREWGLGGLALALAGIIVWRVSRRRRSTARPVPRKAGPLWAARTLASGGAALPEIARRTGLAQDAVAFALRMTGLTVDVRAPAQPARSAREPRVQGQARTNERLRREILDGVRGLNDRRLTYGGGALR